jgi:hypothetical protein
MSHVDEGRLHEYLDDVERQDGTTGRWDEVEAHLAECAECRARLDEARRVRARASDILSASGPLDAAAPPFEEILARKRARSRQRRLFRMNSLSAVGWAATVVFAVGIGWIARGQLANRSLDQVAATNKTTSVVAAAPDSVPAAPRSNESLDVAATEPSSSQINAVGAVAGGRSQNPPEPPVEAEEAAPQALPELRAQQEPEGAPQGAVASAGAPARQDAAAPPAMAEQARRARAEQAAPVPALAQPAAPARDYSGVGLALESWQPTTDAEARHVLGREPFVVPGLPVLAMAVGPVGTVSGILVRQQLPSGDTLSLVQWRDLESDGAAEKAQLGDYADRIAADTAEARVALTREDGYVLLVRGPIPSDSLRVLLGRVR